MTNLFQLGDFTLASGEKSAFKIECDSLTSRDWETLAYLGAKLVGEFGEVVGVPRGGLVFAEALQSYKTFGSPILLIADDVLTTGGSMNRFRAGREAKGVVVFARDYPPEWIYPVFILESAAGWWGWRK